MLKDEQLDRHFFDVFGFVRTDDGVDVLEERPDLEETAVVFEAAEDSAVELFEAGFAFTPAAADFPIDGDLSCGFGLVLSSEDSFADMHKKNTLRECFVVISYTRWPKKVPPLPNYQQLLVLVGSKAQWSVSDHFRIYG